MNKWNPCPEQQSGPISRTFDFFVDELTELQEELDCPDEFIYDFLEVIEIAGLLIVVTQKLDNIK